MKIDVSKLAIGLHELDFSESALELGIDDVVRFPNPIMSHVTIDKSESHIFVKVRVESLAHFSCDRCLKEFDQKLSGDVQLYYEVVHQGGHSHLVDEGTERQQDEVRIYRPGQKEIVLTRDVRDTLLLSIPMKVLCSSDCKGICPYCGKDLNEGPCSCSPREMDPRWEALRVLLDRKAENEKKLQPK